MGSTETARIERFRRAGLVFPTSDTGPLDGPPVLLLHGWPQDGRSWDAVTPGLNAAGYRTYAPTLRGATASANPASRRAYRSAELLADVEAMVGAIGRPVHLVGHDWGAALAWTVAARRPDLARTLAAISVPHPAAFREALKGGRQLRKSWYMGFFQLPVLPELALGPRAARLRLLGSSGQDADSARRDASARTHCAAAASTGTAARCSARHATSAGRPRCRCSRSGATVTSRSRGRRSPAHSATRTARTACWSSRASVTGSRTRYPPNSPRPSPSTSPRASRR